LARRSPRDQRSCHRHLRGVAVTLIVFGASLHLSACDDAGPSARTYVATVRETAAFAAVVVDGERAMAYVCDGVPGDHDGTVPTIQAWFAGPWDGRTVDLGRPAGGRLQAAIDGATLRGAVILPDGRRFTLEGEEVRGRAGLYRAETQGMNPPGVAGWIVAKDGEQRGGGTVVGPIGVTRLDLRQPRFTFPGASQTTPALVVSKNLQGLVPSPLSAEDFDSVSKQTSTSAPR
jgi:hypothetical protein